MDNIIKDIFEKYEVRKTKNQKNAFIDYTTKKATDDGYEVKIETGSWGVKNIVVGDPENAKVIYTAHYDTCPVLPFPNFLTPKNIGLYILYNIGIVLGFALISVLLGVMIRVLIGLTGLDPAIGSIVAELIYIFLLFLILFGPANKHTANDNTSGVTVLLGIMKSLPQEQRDKVAFIFFDLEEAGLLGSGSFAKKHKIIKENTLLINFDCVSDGKEFLIVTKKDSEQYTEVLSNTYLGNEQFNVSVTNKAFYPSDQINFKKGVGIASFNKTKGGMLYMDKIHTAKDTVFQRENIDFLIKGSVKLVELL